MPFWTRRPVEDEETRLSRRVKAIEGDLEDLQTRLKSRLGRIDKRIGMLEGEADDDDAPDVDDRTALTVKLRGRVPP